MESACTIIHFWVGFTLVEDRGKRNSIQVVRYLQGLLQPEQRRKTTTDPDLRKWFYVYSMGDLMTGANENLMAKVYNQIAFERRRCTCLLGVPTVDSNSQIDMFRMKGNGRSDDKNTDYYDYVINDAFLTDEFGGDWQYTSTEGYTMEAFGDDMYEFSTVEVQTTAAQVYAPPDYACCGLGFGGEKYDQNMKQCCPEGAKLLGEECEPSN